GRKLFDGHDGCNPDRNRFRGLCSWIRRPSTGAVSSEGSRAAYRRDLLLRLPRRRYRKLDWGIVARLRRKLYVCFFHRNLRGPGRNRSPSWAVENAQACVSAVRFNLLGERLPVESDFNSPIKPNGLIYNVTRIVSLDRQSSFI